MNKKMVSAILSAALIMTVLGCSGCGNDDSKDASSGGTSDKTVSDSASSETQDDKQTEAKQSGIISVMNGQTYYFPFANYKLNGTECEFLEKLGLSFFSNSHCTLLSGNELYGNIYGSPKQSEGIYHVTIKSDSEFDSEVLYPVEKIAPDLTKPIKDVIYQKYDASEAEEEFNKLILESLRQLRDGNDGFIYFSLGSDRFDWDETLSINNRFGRFAKDGSKIEIIPDMYVAAKTLGDFNYDIKDGMIYYFDNGYSYTDGKVSYDIERAGIYKAGTDGTGKQKLFDIRYTNEEDTSLATEQNENMVTNVHVIGDYLYFSNATKEGMGCLYRMPISGGTPEKVTEKSCMNYFYDAEENELYYRTGSLFTFVERSDMIEKNLSSGEEKVLFATGYKTALGEQFEKYGEYIYFHSNDSYIYTLYRERNMDGEVYDKVNYDASRPCGKRFNIKNSMMEYLFTYEYVDTETDEFLGDKVVWSGGYTVEWKTADEMNEFMKQEHDNAKKLESEGKFDDGSMSKLLTDYYSRFLGDTYSVYEVKEDGIRRYK